MARHLNPELDKIKRPLRSWPRQIEMHVPREAYRLSPHDHRLCRRHRTALPRRESAAQDPARHRTGPGTVGATEALAISPRWAQPRQDHRRPSRRRPRRRLPGRHRPAAAPLRPQLDLVRARRPGLRTAGQDATSRPARHRRPQLRAQTPAPATVCGGRTAGARWPPTAPAHRGTRRKITKGGG